MLAGSSLVEMQWGDQAKEEHHRRNKFEKEAPLEEVIFACQFVAARGAGTLKAREWDACKRSWQVYYFHIIIV
jgi:hypothetical protein